MMNEAASAVVSRENGADDFAVNHRNLTHARVAEEITLDLIAFVGFGEGALGGDLPHREHLVVVVNSHGSNLHSVLPFRYD